MKLRSKKIHIYKAVLQVCSFSTVHVYAQRDIEGRSFYRRCRGKAISITYSEYESVALGIQHPMRVRRIVIGGLSGSTIFFNVI
jgi:hypothetical protein